MKKPIIQIIPLLCRHEAGHFVIARELGFKTDGCKINVNWNGGYKGGCVIHLATSLTSTLETIDYLERRSKVLYAGALSQSLQNGKVDDKEALRIIRSQEGESDHAKARELINLLRSLKYSNFASEKEAQKQLDGLDATIWRKTTDLVESKSAAIQKLEAFFTPQIRVGLDHSFSDSECEAVII